MLMRVEHGRGSVHLTPANKVDDRAGDRAQSATAALARRYSSALTLCTPIWTCLVGTDPFRAGVASLIDDDGARSM